MTNIEALTDESLQCLLYALPLPQREKALGLKNNKRRKEFIVGRILLVKALESVYSSSQVLPTILEREGNSPILGATGYQKGRDYFLSISHSRAWVCCVLHNAPIGVDIEFQKHRPDWAESSVFFMNDHELAFLNSLPTEQDKKHFFYRTWCTKEAIFKASDTKYQEQMTLLSISSTGILADKSDWSLYQKHVSPNYQLALAYRGGHCSIQQVFVDVTNQ